MSFFKKIKEKILTLNYENIDKSKNKKSINQTDQIDIDEYGISFKESKNKFSKKNKKSEIITFDETDELNFDDDSFISDENIYESRKNSKINKTIDKYVVGLEKSNLSFSRQIKDLQNSYPVMNQEFFNKLERRLFCFCFR